MTTAGVHHFPFRACPLCLADLARETTAERISYHCKSCGSVSITVRPRKLGLSIDTTRRGASKS